MPYIATEQQTAAMQNQFGPIKRGIGLISHQLARHWLSIFFKGVRQVALH